MLRNMINESLGDLKGVDSKVIDVLLVENNPEDFELTLLGIKKDNPKLT